MFGVTVEDTWDRYDYHGCGSVTLLRPHWCGRDLIAFCAPTERFCLHWRMGGSPILCSIHRILLSNPWLFIHQFKFRMEATNLATLRRRQVDLYGDSFGFRAAQYLAPSSAGSEPTLNTTKFCHVLICTEKNCNSPCC